LPSTLTGQNNQANNEAVNTAARLRQEAVNKAEEQNRGASYDMHNVMGADGYMHPVSARDLANGVTGGSPATGFADPETHVAQIKEEWEAQTAGNEAAKNQFQVQLLGRALDKVYHGTGGETMLDVGKVLNSMGWLDKDGQDRLANGELAKMTGAEVSGIAAKAIGSGRVPLGLFMYMSKAKPGLLTAHPELALGALSQDLQRSQDLAAFTSSYYANPANVGKRNAASQFNSQYPLEMYESRVTPFDKPAKQEDAKAGYVYKTARGSALWNGSHFVTWGAQ
jgi:hypothetical protein